MQFAIVECRLCFSAGFFLPFAVVFPARTLLCLYKQWLEGRKGGGIYVSVDGGGADELVAVRARLFGAINQKGKTQSGSQAATLWVKPRLGE